MQLTEVRPTESVRSMLNEDGGVLLDIEQGLCFSLSPVASVVWERLQQNCSRTDVLQALCERFPEVDRSTLNSDLDEFLKDLTERKVVQAD